MGRSRSLAVVALAAIMVMVAPAPAEARPHTGAGQGQRCVRVLATGVGQDLGEGRTEATISVRGYPVGTTAAQFAITGVDGNEASFTGPLTFTSAVGTITAQTAGTFDTTTGAFVSRSADLTGTGLLAGVSGRVTLRGTQDLQTGSFTERVTGRLCLPD